MGWDAFLMKICSNLTSFDNLLNFSNPLAIGQNHLLIIFK